MAPGVCGVLRHVPTELAPSDNILIIFSSKSRSFWNLASASLDWGWCGQTKDGTLSLLSEPYNLEILLFSFSLHLVGCVGGG